MKKQDRTYSRTPEDLERKYNLGQLAQGGSSGVDSTKISQALQEISDCRTSINGLLKKISDIEAQIGEGGSDIVYLTEAEYDALPDSKYTDDIEYRITDAGINRLSASNVSYDNSVSGLEATTVQSAIDKVSESLETLTTPNTVKVYENGSDYIELLICGKIVICQGVLSNKTGAITVFPEKYVPITTVRFYVNGIGATLYTNGEFFSSQTLTGFFNFTYLLA